MKFIIEQSDEHLTPVAGLALVGENPLKYKFNKARIPGLSSPDISYGDVITSYFHIIL